MTPGALFWLFVIGLLTSMVFSTLSYVLRALSRVTLEEALIRAKRTHALDAILDTRYDLALTAGTLRLVSNVLVIMAVASYFLAKNEETPHWFSIFGLTLLITVPALLIFTVAVPQAWGKYAGEALLAHTWPYLRFFHWLLWPLVRVLKLFDEIVKRLAGVNIGDDPDTEAEQVEQEIMSVVAEGTAEGTMDEDQQKMIAGVISFRDLQVGSIMTPRTEIVAVASDASLAEVREKILRDGLSRIPVFENTLDNVVGVLYAKDLINLLEERPASAGQPVVNLKALMRPPLFVPRTKPLRDLLKEFRVQHLHMAVVLDEYGGTSGLVTTEDIIEQIVGDIADEYEKPEPSTMNRIDEYTVEVDAKTPIADLNRELGLSLAEDGDYQSIGGLVIAMLGTIPAKGEKLTHEGLAIEVLDADARRVKRLRIEMPTVEAATAAAEEAAH